MVEPHQIALDPTDSDAGGIDSSVAPADLTVSNRYCDRCNRTITPTDERHKCQRCPDFDYCAKCAVNATRIHPGHAFDILGTRPDSDRHEAVSTASRLVADDTDDNGNSNIISVEPHECISCNTITKFVSALPVGLKGPTAPKGGQLPRDATMELQLRLSRLIEATQSGCAFCACMLNKFFGPSNGIGMQYYPSKPWYADPSRPDHEDKRKDVVNWCMETLTKIRSDRFNFGVSAMSSRKGRRLPDIDMIRINVVSLEGHDKDEQRRAFNSAGVLELVVNVFCTADSPAAAYISSRCPNPNTGSPEALNQAASWLNECEKKHGSKCGATSPVQLPARVLDLSGPEIRLHQTSEGETGKYAALSYRWGGTQDFKTTLDSLNRHLSGFPPESLPTTLQNAVTLTRTLGLRYLWVDSKCIIQDSEADKAHQVGMMSSIYRNAYVTICAGNAPDADAGFFKNMADPDTGLWPSLVPMTYHVVDRNATSISDAMKRPCEKTDTIWFTDEDKSLSKTATDELSLRGWCMQERVLSPRVLYYGRWPQWRCSCATESDGGYYAENEFEPEERRLTDALLQLPAGSSDLFRTIALQSAWYRILNDFTRRNLSLASDRLPAVGGIAAAIHRITGVEYLAGLWGNNLLHDMLWYTKTRDWLGRPAEWRASTWSWASVEAPVLYDHLSDDATPLALVHGCQVTPAPQHNAFGEVAAGTLEVSGPFAELKKEDVMALFYRQDLADPPPKSNNVSDWYTQILRDIANEPENRVSIEEAEAALPDRVFGLLAFSRNWRLAFEEKEEETCYFGLLLREVQGGRFERIGAFVNEVAEWLDQTTTPWNTRRILLV